MKNPNGYAYANLSCVNCKFESQMRKIEYMARYIAITQVFKLDNTKFDKAKINKTF